MLIVFKDAEPTLKIRVKDFDATGRNDVQGTAEFFFARMEKEKQMLSTSTLFNAERDTKGATITVLTTYCPDRNIE